MHGAIHFPTQASETQDQALHTFTAHLALAATTRPDLLLTLTLCSPVPEQPTCMPVVLSLDQLLADWMSPLVRAVFLGSCMLSAMQSSIEA